MERKSARGGGPLGPLHYELHELIPLNAISEQLPGVRRGRKIHRSTLIRWATHGRAGVVLNTVKLGGTRMTTERWVIDFMLQTDGPPPTRKLIPPAPPEEGGSGYIDFLKDRGILPD